MVALDGCTGTSMYIWDALWPPTCCWSSMVGLGKVGWLPVKYGGKNGAIPGSGRTDVTGDADGYHICVPCEGMEIGAPLFA